MVCSNSAALFWDWVARIWKGARGVIVEWVREPDTNQRHPGVFTDVLGRSRSVVAPVLISGTSTDGIKLSWAHYKQTW